MLDWLVERLGAAPSDHERRPDARALPDPRAEVSSGPP